jgi:hypothetical protein
MTQQTTQLDYPKQISEMKTSCLYNSLPSDLLERLCDKVELDELRKKNKSLEKENESLKRSVNYLDGFVGLFDDELTSNSLAICCKCGSRNERPWLGDTDVTDYAKTEPSFLICGSKRYCGITPRWTSYNREDDLNATYIEDGEEICIGLEKAFCEPDCDMKCNHWVCSRCVHVQKISRCNWPECRKCNIILK